VVCEGQGGHAQGGGPLHQVVYPGGAVLQGVGAVDMQVDEAHTSYAVEQPLVLRPAQLSDALPPVKSPFASVTTSPHPEEQAHPFTPRPPRMQGVAISL